MCNVLTYPWMGVIDTDGNEIKVGLYDYLANAHLYKRSADNPELAVVRRLQQRLAEVFVMDALGINEDNVEEIFVNGKFDKEKIDAYIEKCEKEGVSFDVFDKERPFFQTDRSTFMKVFEGKESMSVNYLNPRKASGQNKIFCSEIDIEKYKELSTKEVASYYDDYYDRNLKPEDVESISFEDYMNLLLVRHCLSGLGGEGYRSGLACVGVPPMMFQIDAENGNLFQSILLNMPLREDDFFGDDMGLPMYRWNTYEDGAEYLNKYGKVEGLSGMFFPVIYIYPDFDSIDEENGTISKVYRRNMVFDTERIVDAREDWLKNKEPSVATRQKEKKAGKEQSNTTIGINAYDNRYGWMGIRTLWMNIKAYTDSEEHAPLCIKQYTKTGWMRDFCPKIELTAFYLAMHQAKYIMQGQYDCELPMFLLKDPTKQHAVTEAIEEAEKVSTQLLKNIENLDKRLYSSDYTKEGKNKHKKQTIEMMAHHQFMRYAEMEFKNSFLRQLEKAVIDESSVDGNKEVDMAVKNYVANICKESNRILRKTYTPKGRRVAFEKAYSDILKLTKKKKKKKGDIVTVTTKSEEVRTLLERVKNADKRDKLLLRRSDQIPWEELTKGQRVVCLGIVKGLNIPLNEFVIHMAALYIKQGCENGVRFQDCLAEMYENGSASVKNRIDAMLDEERPEFLKSVIKHTTIFSRDKKINIESLLADAMDWPFCTDRWVRTIAGVEEIEKKEEKKEEK